MMPSKKYRIKLDPEERRFLESVVLKQKIDASKRSKAMAFTDENAPDGSISDKVIADRTGLSDNTLARLWQRCCEIGPIETLERKARLTPPVAPKIDGLLEVRLIAEACSPPGGPFPMDSQALGRPDGGSQSDR